MSGSQFLSHLRLFEQREWMEEEPRPDSIHFRGSLNEAAAAAFRSLNLSQQEERDRIESLIREKDERKELGYNYKAKQYIGCHWMHLPTEVYFFTRIRLYFRNHLSRVAPIARQWKFLRLSQQPTLWTNNPPSLFPRKWSGLRSRQKGRGRNVSIKTEEGGLWQIKRQVFPFLFGEKGMSER